MLWLRKLAAVLAVAIGVSLLGLPFPDQLSGERDEETVWLGAAAAPLSAAAARERYGDRVLALDDDALAGHPEVHDAMLALMSVSGGRCVEAASWDAFTAAFGAGDGTGTVYAFRDGLYRIASVERTDNGLGDRLACFEAEHLGVYDNPDWGSFPRLEPADLEPYPALRSAVAKLAAGPVPSDAWGDVTPREWRRFSDRALADVRLGPAFVASGVLVSGRVATLPVPWSLRTPWLPGAARAVGAAALVLGLVLLAGSYRASASRSGIPIAPVAFAVFCDLVLVAGGVFAVAVAADAVWVGPLGQPSLLGLAPEWPSDQRITALHVVAVPALLVALPLLTLFFTSLSSQRVRVDRDGVTSLGAVGSTSVRWEEIERIRVRGQRNPFAFTVADFRSLQRVLDLEAGDRTVTINEPSSRRRKRAILAAMREHVPAARRELLDPLEAW